MKDHNLEHACFEKFATTPAVFRCKLCTCAWDLFTPANPALVYAFYIFVGSGSYIERKYVIFTIFLLFLFSSKMQKFHYYISTTFKIYILVQNVSFSEVTEPNFYLKWHVWFIYLSVVIYMPGLYTCLLLICFVSLCYVKDSYQRKLPKIKWSKNCRFWQIYVP